MARALFILSSSLGLVDKVLWKPRTPAETDQQTHKLGIDTRVSGSSNVRHGPQIYGLIKIRGNPHSRSVATCRV